MTIWTEENQAAARAEGWGIVVTRWGETQLHGFGGRVDEDPKAWEHVVEQAMEGSDLHLAAIAVLRECRSELNLMRSHFRERITEMRRELDSDRPTVDF